MSVSDNLFSSDALTVSALNAQVRQLLENNLQNIWVSGEISNLTRAASGHFYFNLKDDKAQVRCALFKGYATKLTTPLAEGTQVELTGNITLYEARGEYQITVTQVRFSGLGRLFEAYEKLKKQLQAEGLFEASRKKALPTYPRVIGIVTSPAAAALRDVLSTLKRRMGNPQIVLYPTPVQGALSELSIARAIEEANRQSEADVLIVCRGGGSIEDLWAFNEEVTARAIANSAIPVVSGVGHETDFTIADFVADVRAPTPTAAAELVSYDRQQLLQQLAQYQYTFEQLLKRRYENACQHLDWLARNLQHPQQKCIQQRQLLAQQQNQLKQAMGVLIQKKQYALALSAERLPRPDALIPLYRQKLTQQKQGLIQSFDSVFYRSQQALTARADLLDAIAPQKVLQRGFAIVKNNHNQVVTAATQTRPCEVLEVIFADSSLLVNVAEENAKQDELPF